MGIDSVESLIDERNADLVNFNDSNGSSKAKSYFLKPTSSISSYLPPLFDYKTSDFKTPNYSCNFRWWAAPPVDYCNWVDKLAPKFKNKWEKAGIFDAIMASKCQIKQEPITLVTFCQFWCEETNTFVFPWGEATITLEDVMILGNFPVLGEPLNVVDELSEGTLSNMEAKMKQEMYLRKKIKKGINQSSWIDHFMKSDKGDEVEHIAFLTLWLSKFVLISSRKGIAENLFKVAVRLACGVKVALGYPVLAGIYKFLSVVNRYIRSCSTSTLCCMWAPMNLFQVWVWERFPSLRPKVRNLTSVDMHRLARWTMKGPTHDNLAVTKAIVLGDEFIWRPYVMDLTNWSIPSFYMDDCGTWYNSNAGLDEGLRSFVRCLSSCKLVGLSCIEQYHPHRVAMQFGLSQDIPMYMHPSAEEVSENTDMNLDNVKFYVAPRLCKSYVTRNYYNWWKRIEVDLDVNENKEMCHPYASMIESNILDGNKMENIEVHQDLSMMGESRRKRKRKRKENLLNSNIREKLFVRSDAKLTVMRNMDPKPNVLDANENKENGHPRASMIENNILDVNGKENMEVHQDLSIMEESIIENKNHLELNTNVVIDISTVNKELEVDCGKINQLKDLDPTPNILDANESRENGYLYASMIEDNILDGNEKENIEAYQDLSVMGESIIENKNHLELKINEEIGISTFKEELEEDYRKINQLKEEIEIIVAKIKFIESQT